VKIALNILGGILVLFGAIWFLQGINILPGSFMSGQAMWAIIGLVLLVVGGWLLWTVARDRRALGPSR